MIWSGRSRSTRRPPESRVGVGDRSGSRTASLGTVCAWTRANEPCRDDRCHVPLDVGHDRRRRGCGLGGLRERRGRSHHPRSSEGLGSGVAGVSPSAVAVGGRVRLGRERRRQHVSQDEPEDGERRRGDHASDADRAASRSETARSGSRTRPTTACSGSTRCRARPSDHPRGRRADGDRVRRRAVWVANGEDGTVSRIDPRRTYVVDTVAVGNRPSGIAVGARRDLGDRPGSARPLRDCWPTRAHSPVTSGTPPSGRESGLTTTHPTLRETSVSSLGTPYAMAGAASRDNLHVDLPEGTERAGPTGRLSARSSSRLYFVELKYDQLAEPGWPMCGRRREMRGTQGRHKPLQLTRPMSNGSPGVDSFSNSTWSGNCLISRAMPIRARLCRRTCAWAASTGVERV